MPKRTLLVFHNNPDWTQYLVEAFEDTASIPEVARTGPEALAFVRQKNPDVVFIGSELLTQPLIAALKTCRSANGNFRCFRIGTGGSAPQAYPFDESFPEIPPLADFYKRLALHLPLVGPLKLLVVDDEPEIGEVFRDYFDHRTNPVFTVQLARDGVEGEEALVKFLPDVLVLDIKMPRKDGRELYRELKAAGKLPPTIVFFDIVSADEVLEIRRYGNPAFVEKGSKASGMAEMAALIKKMVYFGGG